MKSAERLPPPPDQQYPQQSGEGPRTSWFARLFAMVMFALVLAAFGAAALAGLITFMVFFVLLVPMLLVLFAAAVILGRRRFGVYVVRSFKTSGQGHGRQGDSEQNH